MLYSLRAIQSWTLILAVSIAFLLSGALAAAEEPLPVGSNPAPIDVPHFPSRMHAFVWRNWRLVETVRLARVLGTTEKNVTAVAESMGLPAAGTVASTMRERGYITLIRRNWHLLPYDQLLSLLDMTADELAHTLREDDFLYHKLGHLKPKCEPLVYQEPGKAALGVCPAGRSENRGQSRVQ